MNHPRHRHRIPSSIDSPKPTGRAPWDEVHSVPRDAARRLGRFNAARRRRGLTLLEVILALAIFAMAIAALGELVRIGTDMAEQARDTTRAQLLCESKLSEILAGVQTPSPIERAEFLDEPDWYYSVQLGPTEQQDLVALTVLVETHIERPKPIVYSLVRWIPDPGIELPEEPQEQDGANQSQSGSGSNDSAGEGT